MKSEEKPVRKYYRNLENFAMIGSIAMLLMLIVGFFLVILIVLLSGESIGWLDLVYVPVGVAILFLYMLLVLWLFVVFILVVLVIHPSGFPQLACSGVIALVLYGMSGGSVLAALSNPDYEETRSIVFVVILAVLTLLIYLSALLFVLLKKGTDPKKKRAFALILFPYAPITTAGAMLIVDATIQVFSKGSAEWYLRVLSAVMNPLVSLLLFLSPLILLYGMVENEAAGREPQRGAGDTASLARGEPPTAAA